MTLLAEKFAYLAIKDKKVFPSSVQIQGGAAYYIQKRFGMDSENTAVAYIKRQLANGEYIGDCQVPKYGRIGHLVKLDEHIYAVLSMDTKHLFFVTSNITHLEMIEPVEESIILVNGKEVDTSMIELGDYFISRAVERFDIPKDEVRNLFLDVVTNGTYLCITHSHEDKSPAHLFCKDKRLVYVSLDFSAAVTAYMAPKNSSSGLHEVVNQKIIDMLFKEIERLNKDEKRIARINTKKELEANLRIAQIELEIFTSRKEEKIAALEAEREELLQLRTEVDAEWSELVDDLRRHAIALSSFL